MARRSNGEGSFYQQKDKSWVYQVTYGRKEDGSPYRKAFKGRTKTICKERRAQWEEEQARIKAEEEAQAAAEWIVCLEGRPMQVMQIVRPSR